MKSKVIEFKPKQADYTEFRKSADAGLIYITIVAGGVIAMLTLLMIVMLQGMK